MRDPMTTLVRDSESGTKPVKDVRVAADRPGGQPRPPEQKPKKSLAALLGPLAVLLAAGGVTALVALWPVAPVVLEQSSGPPAVDVKVEPIALVRQPDEIRLPGVLEPFRTVKVAAEVPGQVERVGPREGTEVEPNQPLAWLNTDLLQAARDQASAKYELDKRELERYEGLDKRGVATDIEMFRARAAAEISKAVLAEVNERLKRAVIRSPMAGVLNDLLIEPGEFVTTGTPVAEIMEVDRLKVIVNVPERDVVHVRVGQDARVVVDAIDGFELPGKVYFINVCGDQKCRTFRTEILADNTQRRARAGLIARVILRRGVIEQAIMIPLASVIPTETGYQVYIVQDGKAVSRKIEIGLIVGDRVQAKTGLEADDKLIIDGHRMVGDGSAVSVVESTR